MYRSEHMSQDAWRANRKTTTKATTRFIVDLRRLRGAHKHTVPVIQQRAKINKKRAENSSIAALFYIALPCRKFILPQSHPFGQQRLVRVMSSSWYMSKSLLQISVGIRVPKALGYAKRFSPPMKLHNKLHSHSFSTRSPSLFSELSFLSWPSSLAYHLLCGRESANALMPLSLRFARMLTIMGCV